MSFTYKFPDLFQINAKNSIFLDNCLNISDKTSDSECFSSIIQAVINFLNYSDTLDCQNLLRTGHYIHQHIQYILPDFYFHIFCYNDFIIVPTLIKLLENTETYSRNNDLIYIVLLIIYDILQCNEIDITLFSTSTFFNCIFNLIMPNVIQKSLDHSFLLALTLIKEILKDNPDAIDNFIEQYHFISKFISIFDEVNIEHQMKICDIFIHILNGFSDKLKDINSNKINDFKSFSILKVFIEEKMFDFETQPFFIFDLTSKSIESGFVDITKINIFSSAECIAKNASFKDLKSLLKVISTAILRNPQTDKEVEEKEEFISTFQWGIFSSLLLIILTSTNYPYDLKESSIRILSFIVKDNPTLVFINQEKGYNLNENYLTILIEFLESNTNDYLMAIVINSIIYLIFLAEEEIEVMIKRGYFDLSHPTDTDLRIEYKNQMYKSVGQFIIDALLICEEDLREKIESNLLNNSMLNEECQKLLVTLKLYSENFYILIRKAKNREKKEFKQ